MEDALAWGIATAVLVVVAMGIARIVRAIGGATTRRNLPGPEDRLRHLARVRELRRDGASLEGCVQELRREGLSRGVAQSLVLDVEREVPADVEHQREGIWRGHRFRYPGNWRWQVLEPGLGEDAGIAVDGVGSAMLMLVGHDGDPTGLVAEQERQLREPERRVIREWGPLRGEGCVLRGEHARYRLPMELTMFHPCGTGEAFSVVELLALEEADLVRPGFELIRETFELAGPGRSA